MGFGQYLQTAFFADLVRGLLPAIGAAREAAVAGTADEALHDYRVLVRRLIECTRAWAPMELRRPVLGLARPWVRATNTARDREVEAALLDQLAEEARGNGHGGPAPQREAHQRELEAAIAATRQFLAEPARVEEERCLLELLEGVASFAARPRRLPAGLLKRARRIVALEEGHSHDIRTLHKLRLAAKQVRYGLEPVVTLEPRFAPPLEEATAIQRSLGEHRDWQRLAERLTSLGAPGKWVRTAERLAKKARAAAPRRLHAVTDLLKKHGAKLDPLPPLDEAGLHQRLEACLHKMQRGDEVLRALYFAASMARGHKRRDKSPEFTHVLRAALSLIEEAGVRDPRTLATAVLKDALRRRAQYNQAVLERGFGAEIAQAVSTLTFAAHHDGRLSREENLIANLSCLAHAPAWVRLVSLAARLETLRFLIEWGNEKKLRQCAKETAAFYLPVYATLESEAAGILRARLAEVLIMLKVDLTAAGAHGSY